MHPMCESKCFVTSSFLGTSFHDLLEPPFKNQPRVAHYCIIALLAEVNVGGVIVAAVIGNLNDVSRVGLEWHNL